jgi:hypothetical protein
MAIGLIGRREWWESLRNSSPVNTVSKVMLSIVEALTENFGERGLYRL